MKVHDMPQKSEAWFEIKYGKVGGSTAHMLTTDAKRKTVKNELLSARLEDFVFDEDEANKSLGKHVDRGNELERPARDYLEHFKGIKFVDVGWIQSDIHVLGISPDGVNKELTKSSEVKCPARQNHTSYIMGGDKIPSAYFWQNIAYFAVIDSLEEHHFISFRPECSIEAHIITLTRETVTSFGNKKATVQEWADKLRDEALKMNNEIAEAVEELSKRRSF